MIPTPLDSNPSTKEEIQSLNYVSLLVAEGEIFQCVECGLWCHIECVYGTGYNESNLPDDAKCHMCSTLNVEDKNDDTLDDGCKVYVSYAPLRLEDDSPDLNCNRIIGHHLLDDTVVDDDFIDENDEYNEDRRNILKKNSLKSNPYDSQSSMSSNNILSQKMEDENKNKNDSVSNNTNTKTNTRDICGPKFKSKKYKPRLHDVITAAVYSTSLLKYQSITGEIVSIDGSNIRIHVKVNIFF